MTDAELEALVALGEGITPHDRALRTIAEQGTDLTLEQVTGQRDLWIMGASEWEARLVEAQAALTTLRKQRDELREAVDSFEREYLPSGIRETPEWQAIRKATA